MIMGFNKRVALAKQPKGDATVKWNVRLLQPSRMLVKRQVRKNNWHGIEQLSP
jgi:hypothetical protein